MCLAVVPWKTVKTEFLEAHKSQVLEIGPEWRGLRRHGGGDAEVEIGPEAGNLAARGGQSGCGPVCGAGGRRGAGGVGAAEFQVFRFSESGH